MMTMLQKPYSHFPEVVTIPGPLAPECLVRIYGLLGPDPRRGANRDYRSIIDIGCTIPIACTVVSGKDEKKQMHLAISRYDTGGGPHGLRIMCGRGMGEYVHKLMRENFPNAAIELFGDTNGEKS